MCLLLVGFFQQLSNQPTWITNLVRHPRMINALNVRAILSSSNSFMHSSESSFVPLLMSMRLSSAKIVYLIFHIDSVSSTNHKNLIQERCSK